MKIYLLTILMTSVLAVIPTLSAQAFTNSTGEVKVANMGNWKVRQGGDKVVDGAVQLQLGVAGKILNADIQVKNMKIQFDIMTPAYTIGVKNAVRKRGSKIISSHESTFLGVKSYNLFVVKLIPRDGQDIVTYAWSISAFIEGKLVSMTIAGNIDDLAQNADVQHLLKNLAIKPKR